MSRTGKTDKKSPPAQKKERTAQEGLVLSAYSAEFILSGGYVWGQSAAWFGGAVDSRTWSVGVIAHRMLRSLLTELGR